MPYLVLDGENIYERLREPKFHLLAFSSEQSEFQSIKADVESRYPELVDFNHFQLTRDVAEVFGTNRPFNVFLRPDNYIGFITANTAASEVQKYLSEFKSK